MPIDIEEIVTREMTGLCISCIHFDGCVYRKHSDKIVIQCEVFEGAREGVNTTREEKDRNTMGDVPLRGLCSNCSKSKYCHLPKESSGVWHCEEYE